MPRWGSYFSPDRGAGLNYFLGVLRVVVGMGGFTPNGGDPFEKGR